MAELNGSKTFWIEIEDRLEAGVRSLDEFRFSVLHPISNTVDDATIMDRFSLFMCLEIAKPVPK